MERSGVDTVIAGSAEPVQQSALREAGFIAYGRLDPMVGGDAGLVRKVQGAERVMFSLGDHDLDQYPYLRMPSPAKVLWVWEGAKRARPLPRRDSGREFATDRGLIQSQANGVPLA
jgi:hypothetical protein